MIQIHTDHQEKKQKVFGITKNKYNAMAWIQERKFKKGKRYYIATRINGKVKLLGKCNSYELALKIRNSSEDRLESKRHGFLDESLTVSKMIDSYLKACPLLKKSENTIRIAKYELAKFNDVYGSEKIIDITPQHIERFKINLLSTETKKKNGKKYTVNGTKLCIRNIKTFYNYLLKNGYVNSNPAKGSDGLKAEEVARFLTEEEIEKLKEACRFNKTLWEIIAVALFSGMREQEILNLHSSQIKDGYIYLDSKMTKTRKSRTVPIHSEIAPILKRKGIIFKGWSVWRLQRSFKRAVARARIGSVRFHDTKHSFISQSLKNNILSIGDISAITGNTLDSLKVYLHFSPSGMKQKIDGVSYGLR